MVLDNFGNTIAKYDYEPFGKPISLEDGKTRSKYIYKEQDNENKLAEHGVRKYDYDLGRFLSIDKLWEKDYSMNPYHYSHNNPISRLDPSGYKDPPVSWYMDDAQVKSAEKFWQDKRTWQVLGVAAAIAGTGGSFSALLTTSTSGEALFSSLGLMTSVSSGIINSTKLALPNNKDVQNIPENPGEAFDKIANNKYPVFSFNYIVTTINAVNDGASTVKNVGEFAKTKNNKNTKSETQEIPFYLDFGKTNYKYW